jgi:hypothetical protein
MYQSRLIVFQYRWLWDVATDCGVVLYPEVVWVSASRRINFLHEGLVTFQFCSVNSITNTHIPVYPSS